MNKLLRFSCALLLTLVCNVAMAWTFAGSTPAAGKVTSLQKFTFTYPQSVQWTNEYPTLSLACSNGMSASVMLYDNFMGACEGTVIDQTLTAPGTYTLVIPAGTFTDQSSNPCDEMTYVWTIEGDAQGGDQGNIGDLEGNKRQEELFTKGQLGSKMLESVSLESDGVSMTTLPNTSLGVPVRYNQNEEGKINWNNGTKLVFTAKDNITGIIIDGDWAQFASADKGNYINGAWSGLLAAGETLTLTANDGINVQSIIVLYNGAELQIGGNEEVKAEITLNLTKTSWAKIGATNGESIGTVSCNLPNFDHYTFYIKCDDDPDQFISFADLLDIEGSPKCYSPDANGYDLNKGLHYTLYVEAYDTPQYGVKPIVVYTYQFVGEGKAATVYNNDITVAKVYLKENSQGLGYNVNGEKFDIEFTAPVSTVTAYWAQGMDGTTKLTTAKKNAEGTIWTITLTERALNEEGGISLNIVATDTEGHQLKCACDNTPYGISIQIDLTGEPEPEPELAGAILTVGSDTYELSTEVATEVGKLSAGSTFAYTLTQEGTKTVTFQIYDVTAESMLKSITTCQTFNEGVATFELPIAYELAAGHQYEAQFKEYSTMSTLNKVPTAEQNFKLSGTANVAVYSTVKVVEVTPATSKIITDYNQQVTITFSEAIATLSVKAVLGQMSSVNVASADIATDDNITWTVSLNENYFSEGAVQLNFYATDYQGNRVTDPNNGVGTPETCYINYGWASTLGLPTPKMVQNNKTYTSVESLTFTYDGIGLNQDNATATWSQIVIEKDGVALEMAITESMFRVAGDESVGGTQLTLTLPEVLEYNGVYTVKVPAYAFMLGHDINNFLSGDATYTFTIEGGKEDITTGIMAIENKLQGKNVYTISGVRVQPSRLMKGQIYIVDGQKVILK